MAHTLIDDTLSDLHSDGRSSTSSQDNLTQVPPEELERSCRLEYTKLKSEHDRCRKGAGRARQVCVPGYVMTLSRSAQGCDPSRWQWGKFPYIDLAILLGEFAANDFAQVQRHIKLGAANGWHERMPKSLYLQIEALWDNASYRLSTKKPFEELNPVDTYRIRGRNPCPLREWVGNRKYKISGDAKRLLLAEYRRDSKPSRGTKLALADETGLEYTTISNWFKNRRQRAQHYKVEPSTNPVMTTDLKVAKIETYPPPTCPAKTMSTDLWLGNHDQTLTIHHRPSDPMLDVHPTSGESELQQSLINDYESLALTLSEELHQDINFYDPYLPDHHLLIDRFCKSEHMPWTYHQSAQQYQITNENWSSELC